MERLIFLFVVVLQITSFAQLEVLQKIKIEGRDLTNFQKSFVFESNGTFYYFYRLPGSQNIIIESSSDYGKTWSEYHEITALPL